MTCPAPDAVRVRYYTTTRISAARSDEMLVAYAEAMEANSYAVTKECDGCELVVMPAVKPVLAA